MNCFIVQVNPETGIPEEIGLALVESVEYNIWFNNKQECRILYTCINMEYGWETIFEAVAYARGILCNEQGRFSLDLVFTAGNAIIPVGTLEFCEFYLKRYYKIQFIEAINIPKCLRVRKFIKRNVYEALVSEETKIKKLFNKYDNLVIKSADRCKAMEAEIFNKDNFKIENINSDVTKLFISTLVDIVAEWRVFVYRGEIRDCRQYLGNWEDGNKYNIDIIKQIVAEYSKFDHPPAYTLDVGILSTGEMVIIEVHNFISCGLYGFNNPRILMNMVSGAFKYEVKKRGK